MDQADLSVTITRTDYAPDLTNEWQVRQSDKHLSHHRDIEKALIMVRVIMEQIEADQR